MGYSYMNSSKNSLLSSSLCSVHPDLDVLGFDSSPQIFIFHKLVSVPGTFLLVTLLFVLAHVSLKHVHIESSSKLQKRRNFSVNYVKRLYLPPPPPCNSVAASVNGHE